MKSSHADRCIRQAGYAALAFAVYQLVALPMPLHRIDTTWVVEWMTIAQVGVSLVSGVAALRGNLIAAALMGSYGVYRVALFGLAVVRVLDGTAAQIHWGPAWVLGVALTLPFAIFWVRGGFGGISVYRDRRAKIQVDAI
jgi:hypothetical protein